LRLVKIVASKSDLQARFIHSGTAGGHERNDIREAETGAEKGGVMTEDASVEERVKAIGLRIEAIRDLVKAGLRPEATKALRALKDHLESEFDHMKTTRGKASLSDSERDFYEPFITDVLINGGLARIRSDWHPDKWKDALWDASRYVMQYTHGLRRASNSG
jgi:hypothetical protein